VWEVEKTAAKAEKYRTGWLKPKLTDYKIEALLPRPKNNIQDEQDEDEEENSVHVSQSGSELADD
jgi:hypothetical protein